jgi:RNA polymerase sigma factor (sigma-70 family)
MGLNNLKFLDRNRAWAWGQAKRVSRSTNLSDTEEIHSSCVGRLAKARDAQSTDEFRALATAISRNASISQYHKKRRDLERERMYTLTRDCLGRGSAPSGADIEAATAAMMQLDPELREVLILTVKGKTSEQIAEIQGVSASTVRDRRQAAVKALKGACSDHD